MCDRGKIITFRSTRGTIVNEFPGSRIEFESFLVCRLRAGTSAKMKSGPGEVKMLLDFEQDTAGAAEAQSSRPGIVPVLPSEAEAAADIAYVPRARRVYTMSRPSGVSKFATDYMFMGEDGTPITILAGYDGLTKAFFADVVPCKGTSHGYAERALAHNVLSTSHAKVILQSDQEPNIMKSPVGDSNANGCIERTKPSKDRFVQSRTTLNNNLVRRLVSTVQLSKWLVRHAAWTLTTLHVGSDGTTAHQRIRDKPFNQQIAAFGEQILFKPHKNIGPQQKLSVNWMDGCWLGFNTRTGEHIVSNNAAVVACRSIRRRNKEERWNREML